MDSKQCSRCKLYKQLDNFHNSTKSKDGKQHICKSCKKEYSKWRYNNKKDHILNVCKKYRDSDSGKDTLMQYKEVNRDYIKERKKLYNNTKHGNELNKQHHIKYKNNNQQKIKARKKVQNALKNGTLIKGNCENCGCDSNIEAHHSSYEPDFWLDVKWLCFDCHRKIHND